MHKVSVGKSTYIGYGFAFLAFLTAIIGKASTDNLPLGIPPLTLVLTGAAVAIVTTLGRAAQAIWGSHPVHWGWGSTVTFGLTVIASLQLVLADVTNNAILLGLTPGEMTRIDGYLASALIAGRMLQSAFTNATP